MHVLILPSWYPTIIDSVSGVFFMEQAKALHNYGIKVGVIVPIQRSVKTIRKRKILKFRYQIGFKEEYGIPTFRSLGWSIPKLQKLDFKILEWQTSRLIDLYIKKFGRPDLIHVHSALWGGFAALYIYKHYNIPYKITEHSSAYARGLIKSWHEPYLKEIFKNAVMGIAVSSNLAKLIEPYILGKSIEVIPNVVNTDFFTLSLHSRIKQPFIFLTIALLTHIKAIDILIRAFASVFKNNFNVELWIGGDGPQRAQLEALTRTLGIESQSAFPWFVRS
jgi:glycosyltransferase involved in cell wall biosynthesis